MATSLDRPAYNQTPTQQQQQDPWAAIMPMLLAAFQQKQYSPMDEANADVSRLAALRNDPQGDRNRSYVPGAAAGGPDAAGNPFTNGFFNSSAAQLTPQQRMQSQGGNAMNQWADASMFNGTLPPVQGAAEAAAMASPAPFQLDPSTVAMLGLMQPKPTMQRPTQAPRTFR